MSTKAVKCDTDSEGVKYTEYRYRHRSHSTERYIDSYCQADDNILRVLGDLRYLLSSVTEREIRSISFYYFVLTLSQTSPCFY